jgi:hypothetical protein
MGSKAHTARDNATGFVIFLPKPKIKTQNMLCRCMHPHARTHTYLKNTQPHTNVDIPWPLLQQPFRAWSSCFCSHMHTRARAPTQISTRARRARTNTCKLYQFTSLFGVCTCVLCHIFRLHPACGQMHTCMCMYFTIRPAFMHHLPVAFAQFSSEGK